MNNETLHIESDHNRIRYSKLSFKAFMVKKIKPNIILYLFLIPAITYAIVFSYIPMYGVTIAFRNFNPGLGIMGSPWVGLQWFEKFFGSYILWTLIKNTLTLSLYSLFAGMPIPIILAIAFQYCYSKRFKRIVQTVTYAPHFISVVVLVGMVLLFLSPNSGIVNNVIKAMGGNPINFMMKEEWFSHIYVWSGIWQNAGFSTIIYMAVLSNASTELHEAAIVDGATKIKRVWYIDIPTILPTFAILQILALGGIMSVGFEKAYLMQNSANIMVSEIISTYVYTLGIGQAQFSYTASIGLFNNIINLILLLIANWISRRVTKLGVI